MNSSIQPLAEYPMAAYTQLPSGNWGVRVYTERPDPGSEIVVTTKSGGEKHEVVEKILRQHTDGAWICTLKPNVAPSDKQIAALENMLSFLDQLEDEAEGDSRAAFVKKHGEIDRLDRAAAGKHLDALSKRIDALKKTAERASSSRDAGEE